jgi:hypothetical protein
MQQILDDVRSKCAEGWIAENEKGRPWFNETRTTERNLLIEQVGARLRQLMPFLKPVPTDATAVEPIGTPLTPNEAAAPPPHPIPRPAHPDPAVASSRRPNLDR